MLKKPVVLIGGLVLLTAPQLYVLYAILWFGWLTATPIQHPEIARHYAERWELISIPIGLLWMTCLVALIRTGSPKASLAR
jgi:hypothetical protein